MVTVTTKEAQAILVKRGIDVPYPTIAYWARIGLFKGAERKSEARGPIWRIPLKSVEKFIPPERGRPRNGQHKPR